MRGGLTGKLATAATLPFSGVRRTVSAPKYEHPGSSVVGAMWCIVERRLRSGRNQAAVDEDVAANLAQALERQSRSHWPRRIPAQIWVAAGQGQHIPGESSFFQLAGEPGPRLPGVGRAAQIEGCDGS